MACTLFVPPKVVALSGLAALLLQRHAEQVLSSQRPSTGRAVWGNLRKTLPESQLSFF